MKNNPDVSVIVPVYNVEKYLRECIDSLIRQTLKNIEIILVDDGSRDSSGAICDEYAQKDSRIKVIHKRNEGLFHARQTGAKAAQAGFIGFVDSDDWITDDAVEKLYKGIVQADFSFSTAVFRVYPNRIEKPSAEVFKSNGYTVLDKSQSPGYRFSNWNSLFLKDKFLETVSDMPSFFSHEDWAVTAKYFSLIKTIYIVPEPLYYYRMRKSSLSHTISSEKLNSIDLWNFFIKNKFYKDEEDLKRLRSVLWDDCLFGIAFSKNPEEKRKEAEETFGSFDLRGGGGASKKQILVVLKKTVYNFKNVFSYV